MTMKTLFILYVCIFITFISRVYANNNEMLYIEMLKIELSGEVEDYKNAPHNWKAAMEARAQTLAFYYWVQTEKFGMDSNESITLLLGSWIHEIRKNGTYEKTFVSPEKYQTDGKFHPFSVISADKKNKIKVDTKKEFNRMNAEFINFLVRCEEGHKVRAGIK
jgi:hypothetical protein